jgi:hypothetical protein
VAAVPTQGIGCPLRTTLPNLYPAMVESLIRFVQFSLIPRQYQASISHVMWLYFSQFFLWSQKDTAVHYIGCTFADMDCLGIDAAIGRSHRRSMRFTPSSVATMTAATTPRRSVMSE